MTDKTRGRDYMTTIIAGTITAKQVTTYRNKNRSMEVQLLLKARKRCTGLQHFKSISEERHLKVQALQQAEDKDQLLEV
ncbi:hypothetical protein CHARACLAT_026289 [Characodon lateralis]|uniref:Uncharacterized protein n=1 Tax=Characodon lateralis TaxID=208331 RepID=A0ABU7E3N4_9TELE|nr:hypothetical protein [Characodon lateralis]